MYTFTHRNPEMQIDKTHTALMLADMQNEFLEEKKEGTYYALIEDALKKRNVIANLEQLLKTAQDLGYFIVHSPHWYYPTDGQWVVPAGAIGDYLRSIGFCGRKDPVDLEGFHKSRADYYEPFKKYLVYISIEARLTPTPATFKSRRDFAASGWATYAAAFPLTESATASDHYQTRRARLRPLRHGLDHAVYAQNFRHLGFELGVAAFQVVAHLVRLYLLLIEDLHKVR